MKENNNPNPAKTNVTLHPRRFARKMAKAQLDSRGATGYNKPSTLINGKVGPSIFAQRWKHFAIEAMQPRKKKGVKK